MASKRNQRRKACGHKARYATEQAARQALASMRHQTKSNDFMITYRCDFCNQFHFGHPPARIRQSMAAHARRKGPVMMIKDDD